MLKKKMLILSVVFSLILFANILFASAPSTAPSASAPPKAEGLIIKYKDQGIIQSALQFGAMSQQVQDMLGDLSDQIGMTLNHKSVLATGAQLVSTMDDIQDFEFLEDLADMLEQDPRVVYAEPNLIMYPMMSPNDSRYNEQWHYFENTGGMNLPAAWDKANGNGVIVAVVDTGYVAHSDLAANIISGYDMISDTQRSRDGNGRDSNPADEGDWMKAGDCGNNSPPSNRNSSWHGTHVAGTIAAATNNNKGVAGVAFKAKILPVRALGWCGGTLADIADGVVWAAGGSVSGIPNNQNPAHVINMSLGGGGSCATTYQDAINKARNLGATVVVAAGNENQNTSNVQPANCGGVITVAATDRGGNKADFGGGNGSNYGSHVDVAAPGGETATSSNGVLSTLNTGTTTPQSETYKFYQGTSMATPHVAGVAALLYQMKSSITPDEVESTLKNTTRAFPGSCNQCGSGIVDAKAAVDAIDGGGPGPDPGDNELQNGKAVGVTANKGEWKHYFVSIPSNATNLSMEITGSSGDADLYTRFGSQPTPNSWDCRPYKNGSNEECPVANPKAGKYYVSLYAYSAFSNVNVKASFETGTTPSPQYDLKVNTQGQGSVTSDPSGGRYDGGTSVKLTATPASGWQFSGWSGDLSGSSNPISITMNGNKNVTATFQESSQPNPNSCLGNCGGKAPGGCWCDSMCAQYGDCCSDKASVCSN